MDTGFEGLCRQLGSELGSIATAASAYMYYTHELIAVYTHELIAVYIHEFIAVCIHELIAVYILCMYVSTEQQRILFLSRKHSQNKINTVWRIYYAGLYFCEFFTKLFQRNFRDCPPKSIIT